MASKLKSMNFCDSCGCKRTRVSCFMCERPVCGYCSDTIECRCGLTTQLGDRLCSKRCAIRYKRERRDEGAFEEHLKFLSRRRRSRL